MEIYYHCYDGFNLQSFSFGNLIGYEYTSELPSDRHFLLCDSDSLILEEDLDGCLGFCGDGDILFPQQELPPKPKQLLGYINKLTLKTTEAFLK